MKRSPLRRKTALARGSSTLKRSRIRRGAPMKRKRRARPARLVDRAYTAWIHRQPCCVPGCTRTDIEQHHKREDVGGAAKAHDLDSISLCSLHHVPGIHALAGYFKGWVRQQVRDFVNAHIERLRAIYATQTTTAARAVEVF